MPEAVGVQSHNLWTTREFHQISLLSYEYPKVTFFLSVRGLKKYMEHLQGIKPVFNVERGNFTFVNFFSN